MGSSRPHRDHKRGCLDGLAISRTGRLITTVAHVTTPDGAHLIESPSAARAGHGGPGLRVRVVAVDVGSVNSNYAWAGLDLPRRRPVGEGGRHPEGTALAILEALADGTPVALGFEAPLMVPVSPGWTGQWLDNAREGAPG